jgi:hypothetical protein
MKKIAFDLIRILDWYESSYNYTTPIFARYGENKDPRYQEL